MAISMERCHRLLHHHRGHDHRGVKDATVRCAGSSTHDRLVNSVATTYLAEDRLRGVRIEYGALTTFHNAVRVFEDPRKAASTSASHHDCYLSTKGGRF